MAPRRARPGPSASATGRHAARYTLSTVTILGILRIVAAVGLLLIVLAGAVVLVERARRAKRRLLRSVDKLRGEERRAAAYLEAALGWSAYLTTLRPLAFPEEGVVVNRHRDLATVLRSRAQLERFGSAAVQQLHEAALDEAVTLIELLRSMPGASTPGEPDLAARRHVLRFVLGEISKKVDALERQMHRELQARATVTEPVIELTGWRGAAQSDPTRVPIGARHEAAAEAVQNAEPEVRG